MQEKCTKERILSYPIGEGMSLSQIETFPVPERNFVLVLIAYLGSIILNPPFVSKDIYLVSRHYFDLIPHTFTRYKRVFYNVHLTCNLKEINKKLT